MGTLCRTILTFGYDFHKPILKIDSVNSYSKFTLSYGDYFIEEGWICDIIRYI